MVFFISRSQFSEDGKGNKRIADGSMTKNYNTQDGLPPSSFLNPSLQCRVKRYWLETFSTSAFHPAEEYSIKLLYCIVLVLIHLGDVKVALRCFSSLLRWVVANVANVAGVLV